MLHRMNEDYGRFRKIIKNKVKKDFKKYISNTDVLRSDGKKITVPIYEIDIPRFTYGFAGGIGQGAGDSGEVIQGQIPEDDEPRFYADFTADELAEILGEELELPNLEEKEAGELTVYENKYTSISKKGPASLRIFKKTFKEALKRSISSGEYNPDKPLIVPLKKDERFKYSKPKPLPVSNAVIIYLKDASGSMEKVIDNAKNTAFWSRLWIGTKYKNIEEVFIDYCHFAIEVTKDEFFSIKDYGGTNMLGGLEKCVEVIDSRYKPELWNIYVMHFTDGDYTNLGKENENQIKQYLTERFLQKVNSYFVEEFDLGILRINYSNILEKLHETKYKYKINISSIGNDPEHVMKSLKKFFGKKSHSS